jgi:hypothetical protein
MMSPERRVIATYKDKFNTVREALNKIHELEAKEGNRGAK